MHSIFQAIENTKIELSSTPSATFKYHQSDIQIHEPITIDEFSNDIVGEDIAKIQNYLLNFLETTQIKSTDIDTVFMTGGTSMVKPIRDFMVELFGKEAVKSGDNFNSVANGLAYSHVLFFES